MKNLLYLSLFLFFSACSTTSLDSARGAPQSADVQRQVISFDSSRPKYALIVEPIKVKSERSTEFLRQVRVHGKNLASSAANTELVRRVAHSINNSSYDSHPADTFGKHVLDTMLISSLSDVANFSLVDRKSLVKSGSKIKMQKGEKGPYIIRMTVTEMNGFSEIEEKGFSPLIKGKENPIVMILKMPIHVVSFFFTQFTTLPVEYKSLEIKGMVALDIKILDARTSRIVKSFPVQGTYISKTKEYGSELWGYHSKQKAKSSLGGAVRVAFQTAAKRILDEL